MSFLNYLLAEDAAPAAGGGSNNSWIMFVIIGVVLVLMIVLTIVPQKKRQKQQQQMMDSLTVGTKLMTVGGLVGKITQVNTDNTLIVNVGTETSPTLIVIDRKAVGYVLENVAAPAPAAEESKAEEAPAEPFEEPATEAETPAETEAPAETETPAETEATAQEEEAPAEEPAESEKPEEN